VPATGSNTQAEPDYELPSAAEIAAFLPTSRAEPTGSGAIDDEDAGADITPQAATDTDDEASAESAEAAAEGVAEDPATTEEIPEEEPAAPEPAEEPTAEEPDKTRFQKRIDELTDGRTKAEQETATLREQLAMAKASAPPDLLNPFNLIDSEQELATAVDREEGFMEWIMAHEANPDGGYLSDGKGGQVHFEPEQIRQMKVSTYRILRTAEKRREFIRQRVSRDAEAVAVYPWLRSTKEGLGAEVQSAIEARPYLRQSPDYRTFAGPSAPPPLPASPGSPVLPPSPPSAPASQRRCGGWRLPPLARALSRPSSPAARPWCVRHRELSRMGAVQSPQSKRALPQSSAGSCRHSSVPFQPIILIQSYHVHRTRRSRCSRQSPRSLLGIRQRGIP
jgi:hypothetical protein